MSGKLNAESGFQLVSRFNDRPTLRNLDNVLFADGPNPGDIIQLSGEPAVGKSLLLMKFLTKALLPKTYDGIDLGGLEVGIILIDTDNGICILKLACLMEQFISKIYKDNFYKEEYKPLENASTIEAIIKTSLNNLVILKTYNPEQFEMNCYSIEKILTTDAKMSLIVIDSLTSYYWSEVANHNSIKNMDLYLKQKLDMFIKYAEEYEIVVIFSVQEYFESKQSDFSSFLIKRKIELKKNGNPNELTAYVNGQNTLKYLIDNEGFNSSCGYSGKFEELSNAIKSVYPEIAISSKKGSPGSFEVMINDQLVYSKLRTMAFPDFESVLEVVKEVESGMPPRMVEKQQPIMDCVIL